jgi:hypothetical protein
MNTIEVEFGKCEITICRVIANLFQRYAIYQSLKNGVTVDE